MLLATAAARRRSHQVDGQGALIADPTDTPRRVERAVGKAIQTAQKKGTVDVDLDGGIAALAREVGRAVDVAGRKKDPYGVAAASRELRELMVRLQLDPRSRAAGPIDAVAEALRDLARGERDEPAEPTESPEQPTE